MGSFVSGDIQTADQMALEMAVRDTSKQLEMIPNLSFVLVAGDSSKGFCSASMVGKEVVDVLRMVFGGNESYRVAILNAVNGCFSTGK